MLSNTLGAWLFTQTWQVAVLVLIVTAATARWGRPRPHLAHALWLVVLLKCFTPPIWASPSGLFCWLRPAATPLTVTAGTERGGDWTADSPERSLVGQAVNSDSGLVGIIELAPWESGATPSGAGVMRESWSGMARELVPRAAVGMWLVGAFWALSLCAVRAGRFVARLRSSPSQEIAELTVAMERLRQRLGVRRAVRVRVTRAGARPSWWPRRCPFAAVPRGS